MNQQAMIELSGVTKRYEGRNVLDGVDLSVGRGTVTGLLGTNGSGKTTLIKCAMGLVRPTGGEARVMGEEAWWLGKEAKGRLGYVPQVVELYPWMRARQMLRYTASFYPRWDGALVDRLMGEWDVPGDQRIGTMSVGQRQKLAIVLAMGPDPELLVLDEPVASLDPLARRQFLQLIVDLSAPGKRTVLLSTHITSDLERVADRVAILKDGKVAYHGLIDDLKERVKRLHVMSVGEVLPVRLRVPGTLYERVTGREAVLSVHGDLGEIVANIEGRWRGASVDVQDLNLEDIFLEMHHAE